MRAALDPVLQLNTALLPAVTPTRLHMHTVLTEVIMAITVDHLTPMRPVTTKTLLIHTHICMDKVPVCTLTALMLILPVSITIILIQDLVLLMSLFILTTELPIITTSQATIQKRSLSFTTMATVITSTMIPMVITSIQSTQHKEDHVAEYASLFLSLFLFA